MALSASLDLVGYALMNVSLLESLSRDRHQRMDDSLKFRNMRNRIIARGSPVLEGLAAIKATDEEDARSEVPLFEPLREAVQESVVVAGKRGVALARKAMARGGARNVDRALNPGSHINHVELGEHLDETDLALTGVDMMLGMPRYTFDKELATLVAHATYFKRFVRRISQANGALHAAKPGAEDKKPTPLPKRLEGEWRPAMWMVKAVKQFSGGKVTLRTKDLARAAAAGTIPRSAFEQPKSGKQRHYHVQTVWGALGFQLFKPHWERALAEDFQGARKSPKKRRKGKAS